jgi:F420-dependent oxidoreductase-like protein
MEMLEAYTALGYIAGHTSRVRLGALVTGVTYRHPGILVKQVTTLDVLSGGRANLGIGAAWFDREHLGLGVPFPPLKERFQRLEEALQIAHQMFSGEKAAYSGKHYQLAETLNVPAALSRPHPPILIGGAGEKKTLRLVAKYADATNVFGASPDIVRHKFAVLREHCDARVATTTTSRRRSSRASTLGPPASAQTKSCSSWVGSRRQARRRRSAR